MRGASSACLPRVLGVLPSPYTVGSAGGGAVAERPSPGYTAQCASLIAPYKEAASFRARYSNCSIKPCSSRVRGSIEENSMYS